MSEWSAEQAAHFFELKRFMFKGRTMIHQRFVLPLIDEAEKALAALTAAQERVRAVEGERDAAQATADVLNDASFGWRMLYGETVAERTAALARAEAAEAVLDAVELPLNERHGVYGVSYRCPTCMESWLNDEPEHHVMGCANGIIRAYLQANDATLAQQ